MTAEPVKITLFDLDNADVQDITRTLEAETPGLAPEPVPGSRYGEPTTIILALAVAVPTITALAAWALKSRRKGKIEIRSKVLYSDGTEVDRSLVVSFADSHAPDAEVIKQITEGLGLSGVLKELLTSEAGDGTA